MKNMLSRYGTNHEIKSMSLDEIKIELQNLQLADLKQLKKWFEMYLADEEFRQLELEIKSKKFAA